MDGDSFFASCEVALDPGLEGQPVWVGGGRHGNGIVIARQDGMARDDLRDLAVAVRDQPGVHAVVLIGEPDTGGVALIGAVTKDSELNAAVLIADAAKVVGGGGGKDPALATAGGRDATKIDEALDLARVAAGLPTGTG